MRKALLILLGVFIVLPALAHDFEYTYEGQTLTYTVINEAARTVETRAGYPESENGVCRYVPGNSVSGELILPAHPKDGDVEYTLTQIGTFAFGYNSELTSVTIPETVTTIEETAFRSCSGLTEIYSYPAVPPVLGNDAFDEVTNTIPVYVPAGAVDAYRSAEGWDYFTDFRTLNEDGLEAISAEAEDDAEYFTLQGIRVKTDKLAPGVYIRRIGNRTDKILVK